MIRKSLIALFLVACASFAPVKAQQATIGPSGPALLGTAMTVWMPTIAADSGAITTVGTVTASYFDVGPMRKFQLTIPITTNGTGATGVSFTLPSAPSVANIELSGRETGQLGKSLNGSITSGATVSVRNYDNTYPGGNGTNLQIWGSYIR